MQGKNRKYYNIIRIYLRPVVYADYFALVLGMLKSNKIFC